MLSQRRHGLKVHVSMLEIRKLFSWCPGFFKVNG
jgi:hypothetical protein